MDNKTTLRSVDNLISKPTDVSALVCTVCGKIVWAPVACGECKRLYCSSCITLYVHSYKLCPCGEKFHSLPCSAAVEKVLENLVFCCQVTGCGQFVPYRETQKHQKNCCKVNAKPPLSFYDPNKVVGGFRAGKDSIDAESFDYSMAKQSEKSFCKETLGENLEASGVTINYFPAQSEEEEDNTIIGVPKEVMPELLFVLTKCTVCQKMILSTCAKMCLNCKGHLCVQCSIECSKCGSILCKGCISDKSFCQRCQIALCCYCKELCKECGASLCEECKKACVKCREVYCERCYSLGNLCYTCKREFCGGCLASCTNCKKPICMNCTKKCQGCEQEYCEKCAVQCLECNWTFSNHEINSDVVAVSLNTARAVNQYSDTCFILRGTAEFRKGIHSFEVIPMEIQKDCSGFGFGICTLDDFNEWHKEIDGFKDPAKILLGITANNAGMSSKVEGPRAPLKPGQKYIVKVNLNAKILIITGPNTDLKGKLEADKLYVPLFTRCHGRFKITINPITAFY